MPLRHLCLGMARTLFENLDPDELLVAHVRRDYHDQVLAPLRL
jgi:hypothetical protein